MCVYVATPLERRGEWRIRGSGSLNVVLPGGSLENRSDVEPGRSVFFTKRTDCGSRGVDFLFLLVGFRFLRSNLLLHRAVLSIFFV